MSTIIYVENANGDVKDSGLKSLLESLFRDSKPYLRHGFSLQELSDGLGIPLYRVSAFINQSYDMRFTDFVNLHRIGHAVLLIKQGEACHWSLDGLATQCGFNNRNSFREAFKRFTGQVPSDFIRNDLAFELPLNYRKTG
ncbi:AraC family transcriptional regulator [Paraflavitalea sp. CAU 1676]|uniref:helix-turn-helix domain-containing protein n=1 Tax=Paraflavitalea sp. CAU 1676 TaxID=3032598 RepID=UPI0023DB3FF0|nr:AraC family transcriptional regulator [Paraflavitalea sp. CAU 1676]MDF2189887.1 AraC family transcriptional regulator [Paraflavitalea sp. CAU 1676]